MIERLWSGQSGWWRLLLPLSWIYGGITGLIKLSWRLGLRKPWHAPVPVIVVGNITAGGNGKTPIVIWLTEILRQQGFHPAVISRGYGGHAKHYPIVLDSETSPKMAGDEPVLIYQRTGVPVAVSPKRSEAVDALLDQYPTIDVIVADDGMQHYALARDIEIAVVDGVRRFGNGWWLPAGPLRERPNRLKYVDAVITNGGTAQGDEIPMQLQFGRAVNLLTGEKCSLSEFEAVIAIAGIGHPPRFFNTLRQAGLEPEATISFADHQTYQLQQLLSLTTNHQQLLMTEKDAVKCRAFAQSNWWYLPVDAAIEPVKVEALLQRIRQLISTSMGNN